MDFAPKNTSSLALTSSGGPLEVGGIDLHQNTRRMYNTRRRRFGKIKHSLIRTSGNDVINSRELQKLVPPKVLCVRDFCPLEGGFLVEKPRF